MSLLQRDDSLSLADKQQIDRLCLQFEDEWLAGARPALEPYLRQLPPPSRGVLLRELLLLELDYRRSLREQPLLDDYLPRFPRSAAVIRAAFETAYQRDVVARFVPGTRIGRYEVRRMLGAGAFAIVYLAWDAQLEREVAVKVPHRFLLCDDQSRQRFLEEARTIARLRHPRIVALHDAGKLEDGTIYLVMQHIAGSSLRDVLRAERLSLAESGEIAAKVADAMAAAHCAGVFHRDLKPGNILLDENREPHVCDFGLAVQVTNQRERQGECAGTLSYMPPEQLRGESHLLDGRADIWALGVIYYEMLTGRVPFEGSDRTQLCDEILHRDPRPPRQLDPRISRYHERVCLRCLAKQPAERYSTAADVADELRCLDHGRRRRRARRLCAALITALLLVLISGVVWWWLRAPLWQTPPPLLGSVDLLVWDANNLDRQGVRAVETQTLPLHDGDRLRLNVQLNQPAYIYLLWLDTQGTTLPVFPWVGGCWNGRPGTEEARMFVALPSQQSAGWMMQATQDGVETILLLVRRSPLPTDIDLQQLLRQVSHRSLSPRGSAAWFQDGQPLAVADTLTGPCDRHPVLSSVVGISDPLLHVQRRLADLLRPHFELIRAVSFPVTGKVPAVRSSQPSSTPLSP